MPKCVRRQGELGQRCAEGVGPHRPHGPHSGSGGELQTFGRTSACASGATGGLARVEVGVTSPIPVSRGGGSAGSA